MDIEIGTGPLIAAEIAKAGPAGQAGQDGNGGHLTLVFDYSDVTAPVFIGTVPVASKVISCFVRITEIFSGTSFAVGTITDNDIINVITEADSSSIDTYKTEPNISTTENIWLFTTFSVAPSQGAGEITIFYL